MKLKFINVDVVNKQRLNDYISDSAKTEEIIPSPWPKQNWPNMNYTCDDSVQYIQEIFDLCFKHNGFIAGGAVIKLKRFDQFETSTSGKFQRSFYPIQMMIQSKNKDQVDNFINACQTLKDIDLWFRCQNDYDLFISECRTLFGEKGAYFQTSEGNNATDIIFVSKGTEDSLNPGVQLFSAKIKFQAIHKIFGDPETVMNNFDIMNSMIAYNGKQFIHVKEWQELENTKTLKVSKICAGTLKRISKYICEKQYRNLDKGISKILKDEIVNTIHWINNFDLENIKETNINNLSTFQLQILDRLTTSLMAHKRISEPGSQVASSDAFAGFLDFDYNDSEIESLAVTKAKIVAELISFQQTIIKSLTIEDIVELSSYQFIENDKEYSFMKQALVDKFQQAFEGR